MNTKTIKKLTPKQIEKQNCLKTLKHMVRPGKTINVKLCSVARSGMSRRVELYIAYKGEIWNITQRAAVLLDWRYDPDKGMRVDGCGSDAGFEAVYNLSRCLYPQGFKLPKNQRYGRNGDTSRFDKDGGYALKHNWL